MYLVICENGHRYDRDISRECPECAMLARKAGLYPTQPPNMGWGSFAGKDSRESKDGIPVARWVTCEKGHRYDAARSAECPQCSRRDHHITRVGENTVVEICIPVEPDSKPAVNPRPAKEIRKRTPEENRTYGWLLCVAGPEYGNSFPLRSGNNRIGCGEGNDVRIPDGTLAEYRHGNLIADAADGVFYIRQTGGNSIIRLNGKPILSTHALTRSDTLQIGQSTYVVIPACGADFRWEDWPPAKP